MSQNNDFMNQLGELGKNKEEIKKKAYTIDDVTKDEPQEIDFEAIAAELEEQVEEHESLNSGHVKTTLYIEESVWKAFNALTRGRGEKKSGANEALSDWVVKEYNRRKNR